MVNVIEMRRLLEAAKRDKNPGRFFREMRTALRKKELRPTDFPLRPLFEEFVDDGRELVREFDPQRGGGIDLQMLEASNAVSTSDFANITGQIAYSAVLDAMEREPMVFSAMLRVIPTKFSGEKIAGIGELGDQAATVQEGQPYPLAGVNEDWIETPVTTKRGFIVPVTKEAIFFDRIGMVLERCAAVGEFLALNKEKRCIDCIIDENSTVHRLKWKGTYYATYQATTPWDNVTATNALVDWTDIDNANQTMRAIRDPSTNEFVIVTAKKLICTPQLEATALRIANATEVTVVSPGYATSGNPNETKGHNPVGGMFQVVSSALLGDRLATDTDWFYGDPAKAFAYMENWPVTVVQAPANSEAEFSQDIVVRYKASERGAAATLNPRYMSKSTVA